MKKNNLILFISLVLAVILGSFVTYVATNYALSDISNLTYGITNRPYYIVASLPELNLSFIFVLIIIYILRFLRNREGVKALTKLYLILAIIFSSIGLISSIIAGPVVYHTFVAPNPYPGYLIIHIVLFALIIIASIIYLIKFYPEIKEDKNKQKISVKHVLVSIALSVTMFYTLNRLGTAFFAFSYADPATLYMTWPFYVLLVLPVLVFTNRFLFDYKFYKNHLKSELVISSSLLILLLGGLAFTIVMGMNNTQFISVISPAMGASRLLAKPISLVFFILLSVIPAIGVLVTAIKNNIKK